jgi:hypothetical protein
MGIMELGAIGELVGGVAVIASLLFVGMQIRANARSIQIGSTVNVMGLWSQANEFLCQDPELAELFQTLLSSKESREDLLEGRVRFMLRGVIQRLEAEYFLYTQGLVEGEIWIKHRDYFRNLVSTPTGRTWWANELAENRIYTEAFIRDFGGDV